MVIIAMRTPNGADIGAPIPIKPVPRLGFNLILIGAYTVGEDILKYHYHVHACADCKVRVGSYRSSYRIHMIDRPLPRHD